jgi:hypothetical protein
VFRKTGVEEEEIMKQLMLGALFCAVFPIALWAQNTGQINGTVTDSTGAVLPGVEVNAT